MANLAPDEDELLYDPFNPAFRTNPYPFYERLQVQAPVHLTSTGDYVISRYEDVSTILRAPDVSSNVRESAAPTSAKRHGSRFSGTKNILTLDPPDHTRLRRIVSKAFTPSTIEALRPRIQRLVDDALDRAAERGGMELVDELAFPVPFQVISEMLAMPADEGDELRDLSGIISYAFEPTVDQAGAAAAAAATKKFAAFTKAVIDQRRGQLGDDVLSALILAEESGDRLTDIELRSFVNLLYVAGHETTVNLIGIGVLELLRHPDQLRLWRENPELGANAVNEILRYDGPTHMVTRVPLARMTYEVDGEDVVIPARSIVHALLGVANHDSRVFSDPHELRVDRHNANRHLAFSAGIHYCLGASLAKLEAEIAIGTLIRRFPSIRLAGEPTLRDRVSIRGVERLPLLIG